MNGTNEFKRLTLLTVPWTHGHALVVDHRENVSILNCWLPPLKIFQYSRGKSDQSCWGNPKMSILSPYLEFFFRVPLAQWHNATSYRWKLNLIVNNYHTLYSFVHKIKKKQSIKKVSKSFWLRNLETAFLNIVFARLNKLPNNVLT